MAPAIVGGGGGAAGRRVAARRGLGAARVWGGVPAGPPQLIKPAGPSVQVGHGPVSRLTFFKIIPCRKTKESNTKRTPKILK